MIIALILLVFLNIISAPRGRRYEGAQPGPPPGFRPSPPPGFEPRQPPPQGNDQNNGQSQVQSHEQSQGQSNVQSNEQSLDGFPLVNVFVELIDFDRFYIPDGSPASVCLGTLAMICEMEKPTAFGCVKQGLLIWPLNLPKEVIPDYITEYFDLFRTNLTGGEFLLPREFCFNGADIACEIALIDFKASETTMINALSFTQEEFRKQYQLDIVNYAFYQINTEIYPRAGYVYRYMRHIYDFIDVLPLMDSPRKFCINKYMLNQQ